MMMMRRSVKGGCHVVLSRSLVRTPAVLSLALTQLCQRQPKVRGDIDLKLFWALIKIAHKIMLPVE